LTPPQPPTPLPSRERFHHVQPLREVRPFVPRARQRGGPALAVAGRHGRPGRLGGRPRRPAARGVPRTCRGELDGHAPAQCARVRLLSPAIAFRPPGSDRLAVRPLTPATPATTPTEAERAAKSTC